MNALTHRDQQWSLSSVLLELTYRCNWDCFFCYNDIDLKGKALSKAQYEELLDDLARMQVLTLTLSGGEPLAHPHFFDIGGRARDLGFVVRVKSNGHALRGAMVRRLRDEVDPFIVDVSIHGTTAEVHDRQTRVPGSFDRLLENIVEMKAEGIRVKANFPLTSWNEHQIDDVFPLAERLGVRAQIDPTITKRDNGDTTPLRIRPSAAAIARLEEIVPKTETQAMADDYSGPNCGAGISSVTIDPFGTVYPCVQWRAAVGNLHQRRISEMWSEPSTELLDIRDENFEVAAEVKRRLPTGSGLQFCPGSALLESGQATGSYEAFDYRLQLERGKTNSTALPIVD